MRMPERNAGSFAEVHGLKMYFEIHGDGRPLVLLHGGGSTIETSFGRILPDLAKTHRVVAMELQAHGHTLDIDRPLSFEQDADDVAELLGQLRIPNADFMGFSNGGTTCLQVAIRHSTLVNRMVLASAAFRRDGMQPGFLDGFHHATVEAMPGELREAYLRANPDPKGLQAMFDRDVARMAAFKDISEADIRGIQAPVLVINGDSDVVLAAHALALSKTLPRARLAILPSGHGDYIGEICSVGSGSRLPGLVVAMVEEFLSG
jgi:pimeloyl-ACP methyl ester carboxylesterase